MGVDFSHCNASWSYSGFHSFRVRLANEIGIDLNKMRGFEYHNSSAKGLPWDNITDPIKFLLNHSDCDEYLSPLECTLISPRLRELVANWPDDDYDKHMALRLACGMDHAAALTQRLEFC